MRRPAAALTVTLALGAAACGNANVVTPTDVTQSYVDAVAEGNFPGACALLSAATRTSLLAAAGRRRDCPALLDRCLPSRIRVSAADQSQLLYVTIDIRAAGRRAEGTLSGLPVARAISRVTLVRRRGRWRLTTPGRAVSRCVRRLGAARRSHRRHSAHG